MNCLGQRDHWLRGWEPTASGRHGGAGRRQACNRQPVAWVLLEPGVLFPSLPHAHRLILATSISICICSCPVLGAQPSSRRAGEDNGDRWSVTLGDLEACGEAPAKDLRIPQQHDAFLEGGVRHRRPRPEHVLSGCRQKESRSDFNFRVLHSNSSTSTRNVHWSQVGVCATTTLQTVGINT